MRTIQFSCLVISVLLTTSCSELIEYSPFDMDVSSRQLNTEIISRITNNPGPLGDTLSFAVFSDTHENYDIASEAIADLNRRADISFIINNGDVTNSGLAREFEWYIEVMQESEHPLVTVIGNHDCLVNGMEIYKRLFGPVNFSFVVGDYKFILFNNIIWENQNRAPDYLWLRNELADTSHHNLLFAHMTPLAEDINDLHKMMFEQIVDSTNTIFGGYASAHEFFEYYDRGIHSMVSASIDKREYCLIRITGKEATIERINF